MYSEYHPRPISSHPVTTRTEKGSGYFPASNGGSAQGTGWLCRISRRYPVYGVTEAELRKRYNAVKERLVAKNFTVNEDKCVSFSTSLSFLGYEISSEGVKPEQKHFKNLLQIQPSKDVKKVEAFIGLINHFGRMISIYAAKTRCINELRQKDKPFRWTDECQRAFQSLVDELTCEPLVQPNTLENEVTLTTDAFGKTIGAVLTQNDQPVIYIS